MPSPKCPNCHNPIPLEQSIDVAVSFSTVCQHCNSEIRLSRKWRFLVGMELLLAALFLWRIETLTALFERIDGHPYTTFGALAIIAMFVLLLTWQTIEFVDPLRRKFFSPIR